MTDELDPQIPSHIASDPLDLSSIAPAELLQKGRAYAMEFATIDHEIETLEARVEELKVKRRNLAEVVLPNFFEGILQMDSIGLPEVGDNGVDVRIESFYHANIAKDWPEEQRERAFKYLEELDCEDVISVDVKFSFVRGEYEKARELQDFVRRNWPGANEYPPTLEKSVPWNTLTKVVRELMEDTSRKIDLSILGARAGRVAKIKKRKEKKNGKR